MSFKAKMCIHFGTDILALRVYTLNSLYTNLLGIVIKILHLKEVKYYQFVLLEMNCALFSYITSGMEILLTLIKEAGSISLAGSISSLL